MDKIWLGELIVAYVCLAALWTHYVFQKTGDIKAAFVKGFAVAASFFVAVLAVMYVPDEWIPRWLDRVLLFLVVFGGVLAPLTYGRYLSLVVRNRFVAATRPIRKILKRRRIRFGLYQISWPKEDMSAPRQASSTSRHFVHDECPTCKTGKLVHPLTDGLRTLSYAAEASLPYSLMCDHCGNRFDGFYIRGLQM